MCRIAAYTGRPIALSELLFNPPHSLDEQSYQPKELIDATVNVDGTGVAWWAGQSPEPLRYVTVSAPWQDPNLQGLADRLVGSTILAAVRSASPGIAIGSANVAPFVVGELAAAHNGFVRGFRGPIGKALITSLPEDVYHHLDTINDSKVLFLKIVEHHHGTLEEAVVATLREVANLVEAYDTSATLNLVVAGPGEVVAVRHSIGRPVNSLYFAVTDEGHWIASEPLDDGETWKQVPEHHVVRITDDSLTITALEAP